MALSPNETKPKILMKPEPNPNKTPIGKRKQDLSDESTATVLKVCKSLFRTDFGGQADKSAVVRKKLAAYGIDAGPITCAAVIKLCEEQVESCRRRCFPRMDEAIRRVCGIITKETSP